MASVATVRYGSYTFPVVPQVGIRDATSRIGENGQGPGNIQRSVTLKGKFSGENLNEVQTKIWALQAEFAKDGLQLYYHDGTTARINNVVAHPVSVDIPEDWGQYEADFTIKLIYTPLGDTHYAPITVSYNGYTFSPIPIMGREYSVNRESADSVVRDSAKVTVNISGFIDKGSVSANYTELDALLTAVRTDGVLTYGPFVQSCRVNKFVHNADIGDRRISYSLTMEYDADPSAGGVKKMSSSRSITNGERVVVKYVPFQDDALVQRLGRKGQTITATGFVIADTMDNAKAAAVTEIAANFPSATGRVEMDRDIKEKDTEFRVDWSVTMFYPVPALTGGVYGGSLVFP